MQGCLIFDLLMKEVKNEKVDHVGGGFMPSLFFNADDGTEKE